MPIEILMPALSPTMTSGNLARWLKKEGDEIAPGDIIAEIETDKATMEVDAIDSGTLAKILINTGTNDVAVNSVIGIIKTDSDTEQDVQNAILSASGDASSNTDASAHHIDNPAATHITDSNSNASPVQPLIQNQNINHGSEGSDQHRIKASPLAKRIATQSNTDISKIRGTGPRDRVIKDDVLRFLAAQQTRSECASQTNTANNASSQYAQQNTQLQSQEGTVVTPASPMRKVIAKRLVESKQNIPHFYLSVKCEVSQMLAVRTMLNAKAKVGADGTPEYKISVNDIVIKAAAMALDAVPEVNASWSDGNIVQYQSVDISVAVAVEGGLFTPIIRNANHKNLTAISREVKELAKKAKQGKLTPSEFEGGSLSISNLGMYDVDQFNAIVNPPQSAILAIGSIKDEAIVSSEDASIIAGKILNVTISCDHRVVDGAVAAQFLSKFKQYLSDPITMLV